MCNSNFGISLTPSLLCFHLDLDLAPPEKRDLVNGQPLKLLLCQFSIIFYFYFYYFLLALFTIWSTLKAPPLLALYYSPATHIFQPPVPLSTTLIGLFRARFDLRTEI